MKLVIKKWKRITKKRKSELYDATYYIADLIFKKHNPCNIRTICRIEYRDVGVTCENSYHYSSINVCCGSCPSHKEYGCTIKSLGCKLHLCWAIGQKYKDLTKVLDLFWLITGRFFRIRCYWNKEKCFEEKPYTSNIERYNKKNWK